MATGVSDRNELVLVRIRLHLARQALVRDIMPWFEMSYFELRCRALTRDWMPAECALTGALLVPLPLFASRKVLATQSIPHRRERPAVDQWGHVRFRHIPLPLQQRSQPS